MEKIALIADIHSNIVALKEVLEDIQVSSLLCEMAVFA